MKEFLYVLDPGKKRDYAAEMIFRDTPEIVPGDPTLARPDRIIHFLDVVHIDKYLGVSYPNMVRKIKQRSQIVALVNNHELIVDGNSVGEAVLDIMREEKLKPLAINSHSGKTVTKVFDEFGNIFQNTTEERLKPLKVLKEYHVPKLDLVEAGRLILEQARLRIAKEVNPEYSKDFKEQLEDFKPDPGKKRGYMKFQAEHEDVHDDLVLCFLMASWYLINRKDSNAIPEVEVHTEEETDWNPMDYV